MRVFVGLMFCLLVTIGVFAENGSKPLAENFTETSINGTPQTLENMRGKVVVLTFWSTRCSICSAEIPKLNNISDKYAGRDVVFWGLTMENEAMVAAYLVRKPFKFTIFPNSLGTLLKYADRDSKGNPNVGYPTYFVINQQGEIEYKGSGYNKTASIDSAVGKLLAH